MARLSRNILLIFSVLAFSASVVFAAEEFTITTYYPSPYGSYNSLFTDKLGVGDNNSDGDLTAADVPTATGDVWIKGKVGIGIINPGYQFMVKTSGGASTNTVFANNNFVSGASGSALLVMQGAPTGNTYSALQAYTGGLTAFGNLILQNFSGNVGIGAIPGSTSKLDVNGNFITRTNADVLGKLDVRGRADVGGNFDVLGEVNLAKTLHVARDLFVGHDLIVSGTLSKGAGTFLIDHPLDPKNKILRHSFVESPDMKNIYDGITALDKNGEAIVKLPDYFEALNKDFRYQLTAIGLPASNLYIKSKILDGYFVIGGGNPGQEVSWQVTGIRQDAYAIKNPIIVEEEKGKGNDYQKGEYLYREGNN